MKAKQILLIIAVLAVGLARAGAQGSIFPPPIGGFITNRAEIPPGFSTIANPFDNYRLVITPVGDEASFSAYLIDNTLERLFPNLPEGTTLYKFDSSTDRYTVNVFLRHTWSRPHETLNPGEGALIFNPSRRSAHVDFIRWYGFVISLNPGPIVELPGGLALIGLPGVLWELPQTNPASPFLFYLRPYFNPQDGDVVYTFDRRHTRFEPHHFRAGRGWDRVPDVEDTEAFFVQTREPRPIRALYNYIPFPPLVVMPITQLDSLQTGTPAPADEPSAQAK